ncbi:MAG: RNA-binding protein Hfq [Symbiobacteriaceae bacterium]|jgi:host factor-I protein|nr:RNA-binding protein Hfq [Symbiobacteriaceae bacterium]
MIKSQANLQDGFLNQCRKENILVTVYLVNGYQLKGFIKGFDNFTVILENEGKQQLVYKHALSTLMPSRNVNLSQLIAPREEESQA